MSAPDTNIDKQTSRHWPSILGICVALFLGVVIGLVLASILDLNGPQMSAALELAPLKMSTHIADAA